jgi:hypothetical protein
VAGEAKSDNAYTIGSGAAFFAACRLFAASSCHNPKYPKMATNVSTTRALPKSLNFTAIFAILHFIKTFVETAQ